jgi:mono/diheme cytochrome c family protein
MVTVQQATGKETVSFAHEIAPVLAANCTGCHGTMNPRSGFSLNTFEQLLRGGDRGEPVLPGRPADSLLVKKLRGSADGARMPMNRPPLDDAIIAKIETWIEEGARFDAPSPRQPIAEVAAIAKAQASTHEELSAERALLAAGNWRRGMPGTALLQNETTNFLVMGGGRIGENTLADVAQRAEAVARKVADTLKAPRDQPLVKGRVTLYVFGDRYDYGEFGKMVERRDVPPAWRGHWGYTIVDAYGAVLVPRADDYSLDALIAQQLASVYIASQGGVPRWFAEGCGRVLASRLATGSDNRVRAWDDQLPHIFAKMSAADDLLTGKLAPEDADIASYSFAKFLMADPRKFGALLDALRNGDDFDKAFASTYGGTPTQLAAVWARKPPRARSSR